jgi:hypothetical protein
MDLHELSTRGMEVDQDEDGCALDAICEDCCCALTVERDALLGTVARLRELLTREVLERITHRLPQSCRTCPHYIGGQDECTNPYECETDAAALRAAAALLWPGEG